MTRRVAEPEFRDSSNAPHDPYVQREYHRLTTLRSTSLIAPASEVRAPLYLGRLLPYYSIGAVALPTRLTSSVLEVAALEGKRCLDLTDQLRKLSINLFQVPSGRVLYAVTIDVVASAEDLVPILEDFYYESVEVTLSDRETATIRDLVDQEMGAVFPSLPWSSETDLHQVLFPSPQLSGLSAPEGGLIIRKELLRSLVYRVRSSQRDGFTSIHAFLVNC